VEADMYKEDLLSNSLMITTFPFILNSQKTYRTASLKTDSTDLTITTTIKKLYAKSTLIRAADIQVAAINQKVVLRGQVNTKMQYNRAITLATLVPGVKILNADNLLIKVGKAPFKDWYTSVKVKSLLSKKKLFGSKSIELWPVKIETKDSVVYISGKVHSIKEKNNLIHLVQSISGVQNVSSSIIVQ
jgi:osmotically-inducible protein OsmY